MQPAAVPAVQVLVEPAAAALDAGAPVLGVAVGRQRPAHRPDDVVADREDGLAQRGAHAEHGDRRGVRLRVVGRHPRR